MAKIGSVCTGSYLGFWSKNRPKMGQKNGPKFAPKSGKDFQNGQKWSFWGYPKNDRKIDHFLRPPKWFFQVAKILKTLSYEFQHFGQNRSKGEKKGVKKWPPKTRKSGNLRLFGQKMTFFGFGGSPKSRKTRFFWHFCELMLTKVPECISSGFGFFRVFKSALFVFLKNDPFFEARK